MPTRAGVFTLGAPFVLGLAAINSSNNLLFLLLGVSLSLILLSGILSERMVWGLEVNIEPAGEAYADEPARLLVSIHRWRYRPGDAPLFGLRVKERGRARAGALDVRLPILEGQSGRVLGERVFATRGKLALGPTEIRTVYPFALLTKICDLDAGCTLIVRPRRIPVPEALADPEGAIAEGRADARRGHGQDVYGLRERQEFDPLYRVHALRSLRLDREVVVETEAARRPMAWLGLANIAGADPEAFERAIEIAAATLVEWEDRGFAVGLVTAGETFHPGQADAHALLDVLALMGLEAGLADPGRAGPFWLIPEGALLPPSVRELSAGVAIIDRTGSVQLAAPRASIGPEAAA
jgi:uncharacterized protein (DUF58 family)